MRRIVVFGHSFAALHAIRELQSALEGRTQLELSLVVPRDSFVYSPLLPHVVSGALEPGSLAFPLSRVLTPSTALERAQIRGIDIDNRELVAETERFRFDYLLLAPRTRPDWGGCRPARERPPAWTLDGAAELHDALDDAIRDRDTDEESSDRGNPRAVVVGGGPAGVEIASELRRAGQGTARDRQAEADRTSPDLAVRLIEQQQCLLPSAPEPLRRAVRAHFRSSGIQWETDARAVARDDEGVGLADGSRRSADMVAHCTGVRPPNWLEDSPLSTDAEGRIPVEADLTVPGQAGIFAAGSATAPSEAPPLRAHLEADQGRRAAENLRAALSGRTLRPWSPDDDSWLLTLGSSGAAVFKGESLMTGRSARVLYRLRHASWMPAPLAERGPAQEWLQRGPADWN